MVEPTDIVDTLSKTELVSKLNQKKKASSEMEQRQFAESLKETISDKAQRTQESMKSDMLIISKDKMEQERKKKDRKKMKKAGSQDDNSDQEETQHLDLKA